MKWYLNLVVMMLIGYLMLGGIFVEGLENDVRAEPIPTDIAELNNKIGDVRLEIMNRIDTLENRVGRVETQGERNRLGIEDNQRDITYLKNKILNAEKELTAVD